MVGDAAPHRVEVLRTTIDLLRQHLPSDWSVRPVSSPLVSPGSVVDALVDLGAPSGEHVTVGVGHRTGMVARDMPAVVEQLRRAGADVPGPTVVLVAARYLSESVRDRLDQEGISYADATGNLRVAVASLGAYLCLADSGADHDPWRRPGRPRRTLKGAPAARVVRVLVDLYAPISITACLRLHAVRKTSEVAPSARSKDPIRRKQSRCISWTNLSKNIPNAPASFLAICCQKSSSETGV